MVLLYLEGFTAGYATRKKQIFPFRVRKERLQLSKAALSEG